MAKKSNRKTAGQKIKGEKPGRTKGEKPNMSRTKKKLTVGRISDVM
jgi:hypothetical protein